MIRAGKRVLKKEFRAPGRPRGFDPERALQQALGVFWRQGYEGASLRELTKAMGINRPSMYAAFGNKERLFRRVLDRYASESASYVREGLERPTARGAVEAILLGAAEELSAAGHPRGCLLVQGALACGRESQRIQRELCSRRGEGELAIRQRLERAKTQGDLAPDADAGELAGYVMAVLHGMSVEAVSGASREKLRGIARRAMQAWPA
jgi:AcrR family transcriptional regulator